MGRKFELDETLLSWCKKMCNMKPTNRMEQFIELLFSRVQLALENQVLQILF